MLEHAQQRANHAFAFFKGTCTRGIYDNMKTAVETVFIGKDRQFNRRFLQMCGHYLVEPAACTPASGWEKGQGLPSRKRGSRTRSGATKRAAQDLSAIACVAMTVESSYQRADLV
jgi:transposase